jgi:TATA-box binding protein (TBP) (component of TFIID and TFIIIB)
MEDTLNMYANNFFRFMSEIHGNKHNVNVSTMTILCHLDTKCLDIKEFSKKFVNDDVVIKYATTPQDFVVTKRGKIKKNFFNQVTLNYQDISNKSIKIFSNGKLQITGISSKLESEYVINQIVSWINCTLNICVRPIKKYIGMINSNFSVGKCIDLISLNKLLNTNVKVLSIYNPESYPAINMKYNIDDTRVSVFIFGTGNVVITGGKCIVHIHKTYKFIINILNNNDHVFRNEKIRLPKEETLIDGYTIRQYQSCVY